MTPRRATAAATARTSPRSPPGSGRASGRSTRTASGSSTAWAPLRAPSWASRRSSTAPAARPPGGRLHGSGGAGVRRRRAYLEQLVGQPGPRPLQPGLTRVRLSGARRPAHDRRQPGDGRGVRRRERGRRPSRRGERGLGEHRLSGNGQERHHRRRLGGAHVRWVRSPVGSTTGVLTSRATSSTSPAEARPTTAA